MTGPTRRGVVIVAIVALLSAACGGKGNGDAAGDADGTTRPTDRLGNPIRPGDDWAAGDANGGDGAGSGEDDADGGAGNGSDSSEGGAGASATPTTELTCERPEPPAFDPSQAPPGFDPNAPLAEAQDDFPLEVSVKPGEADAGETVEITAVAVAPSRTLVVVVAQFHDRESHGMEAAKFADATGRAVFKGPIPHDAPEGFVVITVTAQTEDDLSAIETLDFTVTGERCT